jgi:Homeodomain-like domain
MARTVSLLLSAQHSADLQGVIEDRGRPVKHVQRAQIILRSAERLPVLEIAKRVGVSRPMVWRWQQRFAEEGIEGLLRDKTRPPGIPPVPQAKVHAVVERTLREPPGEGPPPWLAPSLSNNGASVARGSPQYERGFAFDL